MNLIIIASQQLVILVKELRAHLLNLLEFLLILSLLNVTLLLDLNPCLCNECLKLCALRY
jgi:hypothetical protein